MKRLTRKQLLEVADRLYDGLHEITYGSPARHRSHEEMRGTAILAIREAHRMGFDPTEAEQPVTWASIQPKELR